MKTSDEPAHFSVMTDVGRIYTLEIYAVQSVHTLRKYRYVIKEVAKYGSESSKCQVSIKDFKSHV